MSTEERERWSAALRAGGKSHDARANLREALEQMYKKKLYVFGGHDTTKALTRLLAWAKNNGRAFPPLWNHFPCLIFALPTSFGDFVMQLDVVGELDNEPIAQEVSCLDRVQRARYRFESKWPKYDDYLAASPQETKDWLDIISKSIPRTVLQHPPNF